MAELKHKLNRRWYKFRDAGATPEEATKLTAKHYKLPIRSVAQLVSNAQRENRSTYYGGYECLDPNEYDFEMIANHLQALKWLK